MSNEEKIIEIMETLISEKGYSNDHLDALKTIFQKIANKENLEIEDLAKNSMDLLEK